MMAEGLTEISFLFTKSLQLDNDRSSILSEKFYISKYQISK